MRSKFNGLHILTGVMLRKSSADVNDYIRGHSIPEKRAIRNKRKKTKQKKNNNNGMQHYSYFKVNIPLRGGKGSVKYQ